MGRGLRGRTPPRSSDLTEASRATAASHRSAHLRKAGSRRETRHGQKHAFGHHQQFTECRLLVLLTAGLFQLRPWLNLTTAIALLEKATPSLNVESCFRPLMPGSSSDCLPARSRKPPGRPAKATASRGTTTRAMRAASLGMSSCS